jgi:hypothetical protein
MVRARGEEGQAAVELVALLPVLALVAALAWQSVVAGQAWWMAGAAAREAARAQALGGDPEAAARGVLPGALRDGVRVRRDGEGVAVRLAIPVVLGSRSSLGAVTARARMEPQS